MSLKSKMKRVTKNNILKYIQMKKEYEKSPSTMLLQDINRYTTEVINRDKKYFQKLSSYNLKNSELKYCM